MAEEETFGPPPTGQLPSLHTGVSLLPQKEPALLWNCLSRGILSVHPGVYL